LDTPRELRELNIIKEKAKHMALQFDKTKTFLFREGIEIGKAEAKAEGITEGMAADQQLIENCP
jgi:predicted transcriptional regulator